MSKQELEKKLGKIHRKCKQQIFKKLQREMVDNVLCYVLWQTEIKRRNCTFSYGVESLNIFFRGILDRFRRNNFTKSDRYEK